MGKIKTREKIKDIKVFDRAVDVSTHMKNTFVKSKDTAEQTQEPGHNSPSEYATENISGSARNTAEQAAHHLKNPRKKAADNWDKAKQNLQEAKRQLPKERKRAAEQAKRTAEKAQKTADTLKGKADQARKTAQEAQKIVTDAKRALQQTRQAGRQSVQTARQSVKTSRQAEKGIKQSVKTIKLAGKGTVKATQKSVKTAEHTAKVTVKTAKQTAKTAQKSAQAAAKAAKAAARASKAAAKAAAQTAKAAVKATIATVKAIIAATKALISAIAAGGWVAVVIILIICMIGLLVGSIFGIFFSGEDSGNGYTMPLAIAEINTEYADKISEIRSGNAHDEVSMSGSRAEWKDVLAVYAVKTNTDPENGQDVATMDEVKKELLRSVFWDMNTITHRSEVKEITEYIITDDGEGNLVETPQTITKTVLYITISHKSVNEMSAQYGFTEQQKAQLTELMSDEYADLWSAALYGIHNGSADIVAVAESQIGNVGGQPYWSWYGFNSRVEWCATFVSWCANECGYIEAGIIPKFAACESQGVVWFKNRGLWQNGGYIPAPGDIIFFDWNGDGRAQHVGIVEYVEGEFVHTIEGNTSNSCARRSYRLDSVKILGYGTPMY